LATARSRLYWLPLSVGTLAIVASQSRAGVTLWGICLVWTALSAARRRPKRMVWLGALLLLAVWLLSDRFWFRFQRLLSGDDLGQRLELAKIGWQLFLEHPWLGVGNGQFAVHSGGLVAHNLFVEVFAEGGVLLGGVFLLLVALLLRSIVRVASTAPQWAAVSLLTILLSLTGYMDERVLTIGLLFAPLTDATGPGTLREC